MEVLLFLLFTTVSTVMYLYLHKKTRMNLKFLYIDNIIVILLSFVFSVLILRLIIRQVVPPMAFFITVIIGWLLVVGIGYSITMIRFWRTPTRKVEARSNEIVSPADGNIIYIKKIEDGEKPISIKNGTIAELSELTKTTLIASPCWLIGINMTPWDVHKNSSPIEGEIILNQHTKGEFLSLKNFNALTQNERHSYVIKGTHSLVAVIQTASKGVRRIDSYVTLGQTVEKGQWLGMIRFGSQVDLIIPYEASLKVEIGQQIYATKTIIASL